MALSETISAGTSKVMGGALQELIAQTLPGGQFLQTLLKDPDGNISFNPFRKPKPKTPNTTVDAAEVAKIKKDISIHSTYTLNPITGIWRGLKRLFGGRTKERSLEITFQKAKDYGTQYDAYKFMHEMLPLLINQLKKSSSKKVSWLQKLLGLQGSNDKFISQDPVIKANTEALRAWINPFSKLLNGQIEGQSLRSDDINYLNRYLGELRELPQGLKEYVLPEFEAILKQVENMKTQATALRTNPQKELHKAKAS